MDKNGVSSKNTNGCCEKLRVALRNTSPLIRTVSFAKPTTASPANVSTTTLRDRCVRVSSVDSFSINQSSPNRSSKTANLKDRCPKNFKQSVAPAPAPADHKKEADQKVVIVQEVSSPKAINQAKPNKATVLPIHGNEDRVPAIPHVGGKSSIAESIDGLFSEYIDRAGRKIRSPMNVGVKKPVPRDSFNDRISNYISRTMNQFHKAASFNEGKEKRLK